VGIPVLNPVQVRAKDMEPGKLKAEFGDRLSFHGGVDAQEALPYGSPEEVGSRGGGEKTHKNTGRKRWLSPWFLPFHPVRCPTGKHMSALCRRPKPGVVMKTDN